MSHSLLASSSGSSLEASTWEVENRKPRVRHIFSSCEKCCLRQSVSFGNNHVGSREPSPLVARNLSRFTPTATEASRPRMNDGANRPQSSQTRRMRITCSLAFSACSLLSARAMAMLKCSMMSGSDFSNSRRYAQADGRELAVLWRMSLTMRRRDILSVISVSRIVSAWVMHSAISTAMSAWSRQKAIPSRTVHLAPLTVRSSCSSRSQSVSLSLLPPASPFLSLSRLWRSCVARSSRRSRWRSSSSSSGTQPGRGPLAATCRSAAAGAAATPSLGSGLASAFAAAGAEEKLVFRLLDAGPSQGGGCHQAPPSQTRNVSVRQILKLSPCAKAKALQR
mmetsp:Transcript_39624/g.113451  ORF Transcript_39624/g.113451 Transcript_39624/m.113451 type:complete len:337 (+) Transcript_39624:52-1062(+)